jgi:putative membrane protein
MIALNHVSPLVAGSDWVHDGFWWIPVLLLWATVLGVGIWFAVRTVRPSERSGIERARAILAERYARGEVSVEQYRERLDELDRHH